MKFFSKQNYTVQLNTYSVRRAIRCIIFDLFGVYILISDIQILNNSLLLIKKYPLLKTNRHLRFDDQKDQTYAIFEYLELVKKFLQESKKIKEVLRD